MSAQEFQIPIGEYNESITNVPENADIEQNPENNIVYLKVGSNNLNAFDETKARQVVNNSYDDIENKKVKELEGHVVTLHIGNVIDIFRNHELSKYIVITPEFEEMAKDIAA